MPIFTQISDSNHYSDFWCQSLLRSLMPIFTQISWAKHQKVVRGLPDWKTALRMANLPNNGGSRLFPLKLKKSFNCFNVNVWLVTHVILFFVRNFDSFWVQFWQKQKYDFVLLPQESLLGHMGNGWLIKDTNYLKRNLWYIFIRTVSEYINDWDWKTCPHDIKSKSLKVQSTWFITRQTYVRYCKWWRLSNLEQEKMWLKRNWHTDRALWNKKKCD